MSIMVTRNILLAALVQAVTLACLVFALASCGGEQPDPAPVSSAKIMTATNSMTAFSLAGVAGEINEAEKTISVTMPNGVDVTALVATFTTTGESVTVGTTGQASSTTQNDFSSPVAYTITAANGTTSIYYVTAIVAPNPAPDIPAAPVAQMPSAAAPDKVDMPIAPLPRSSTPIAAHLPPPVPAVPAVPAVPVPYIGLNDTGVTSCLDPIGATFSSNCSSTGQDGEYGRDAKMVSGSSKKVGAGSAGFDWTKLNAVGVSLSSDATSWSCVRDNVTGLTWENKTIDNGPVTYTNFTPVTPDKADYASMANASSLCRRANWRLPTREELLGIVDYSVASPGPKIDTSAFQNTPPGSVYWSSSPVGGSPGYAWAVDFGKGSVDYSYRSYTGHIRLVSDGP